MSFEHIGGRSSEVNEGREVDELSEGGTEVSEDEDGPEHSIEENMDKLEGDEGNEIGEADESGDGVSEGDEDAEHSLEDNMDKLDEEENTEDDRDAPTLPGFEDMEDEEVARGPENPNDAGEATADKTDSGAETKPDEGKSEAEKFRESLRVNVGDRPSTPESKLDSEPNADDGDDFDDWSRQRSLYHEDRGDDVER